MLLLGPAQMDGMHGGYNVRVDQQQSAAAHSAGSTEQPIPGTGQAGPASAPVQTLPRLTKRDFLWMSAVGDLGDLQEALCGSDAQAAGAAGGRYM